MRVLHVLGELRASGGEVMLRDAIEEFREHRVEPIILSTGDSVGEFAAEFRKKGAEVHHVPFRKSAAFALEWVFRRKAASDSERFRPPVPRVIGH